MRNGKRFAVRGVLHNPLLVGGLLLPFLAVATPGGSQPQDDTARPAKPTPAPIVRSDNTAAHKGTVEAVALNPEGTMLVSGGRDDYLRLWGWRDKTWKMLDESKSHAHYPFTAAFSPNGKWVATGSLDSTVKLWKINGDKLEEFSSLLGQVGIVRAVAFRPTNKDTHVVAAAGLDARLTVWEVKEGLPPKEYTILAPPGDMALGSLNSLAFSAEGMFLAVSTSNGPVLLYKVDATAQTVTFHDKIPAFRSGQTPVALTALAMKSDSGNNGPDLLLGGCGDGCLYWCDLDATKGSRVLRRVPGGKHAKLVNCATLVEYRTEEGGKLIRRYELWTGGEDGTVLVWNVQVEVSNATDKEHKVVQYREMACQVTRGVRALAVVPHRFAILGTPPVSGSESTTLHSLPLSSGGN